MKQEWDKLEVGLKTKIKNQNTYIEVSSSLNPPATIEQVKLFENKLKLRLPSDFKESVLVHDGVSRPTKGSENFWLILDVVDDNPVGIYLDSLKTNYETWESYCEDKIGYEDEEYEEKGPFAEPNSGIQNVVWDKHWIPISNLMGELYCIDLNPTPQGKVGQIIKVGSGTSTVSDDWHRVVGKSFIDIFIRGSKKYLDIISKQKS